MSKHDAEKIEAAAAAHINATADQVLRQQQLSAYRPRYRGAEEFAHLYSELDPLVIKQHQLQQEQLIRIIHSTVSQDADDNDYETEEEANDFDWPEVDEFKSVHTLPLVEEQLAEDYERDVQLQETARAAQKKAKSAKSPPASSETHESTDPQLNSSEGSIDE